MTTAPLTSKPTRVVVYFDLRTNGYRTALVQEGRKYLHVLVFDAPLCVRKKVGKVESKYMHDLEWNEKPYPYKRAIREYRKFGRKHGITESARKFLDRAIPMEKDG